MRAVNTPEPPALQRRLGIADAVTIGLGSMIGAGIFVALAPAAAAAGSGLLIGLALTAVNYVGIKKSALLTRVIVAVVLAVLAVVVVTLLGFGDADASRLALGA